MKAIAYDTMDAGSRETARKALSYIRLHPTDEMLRGFQSVVDFGCGVGSWLAAARDIGCKGPFLGIDRAAVPVERRVIPPGEFQEWDFTIGFPHGDRFDLVICLEVAEHLPEPYADGLVEALASASDLILWGAAIPGQGGDNHLNERWPSYWAGKFALHGYGALEDIRWHLWRDETAKPWYRQNIMIFQKGADIVKPLDAVHPEIFRRRIEAARKAAK